MNQREIFARNLSRYMNMRGVTQADIVAKLGVTSATASDWSNGKKYPRVDAMQRLADLLGVRISDLTSEEQGNNGMYLINEDEKELVAIFRKLGRRERHEMMAKAYELEKEAKTAKPEIALGDVPNVRQRY